MPWRFSAHGTAAEVRGRAAEFFHSETGFIHQNLTWANIRLANRVSDVIERYLGNRANDERVTVKASPHGIFAAPITAPPPPQAVAVAKPKVPRRYKKPLVRSSW